MVESIVYHKVIADNTGYIVERRDQFYSNNYTIINVEYNNTIYKRILFDRKPSKKAFKELLKLLGLKVAFIEENYLSSYTYLKEV